MNNTTPLLNKPNIDITFNKIKIGIARLLIMIFFFPRWIIKRLFRRQLPFKEKYYLMQMFRFFVKTYYVQISYPNPFDPQKIIQLIVNLCENVQQTYFLDRQRYELNELQLIVEGMQEANKFIDIGANIGVYALTIGQTFPHKGVLTIEPLPENFNSLQANIMINNLSNCEPRQGAVSGAGTSLRFYVNPIHDGGGSLLPPDVYRTGDIILDAKSYQAQHPDFQAWVEVETFTLDELIVEKSVLKIDVEGAEVDVLKSGYEVLKAGLVDLIMVEVHEDSVAEVIPLLAELEFDSFLLPDYVLITEGSELSWFVKNFVCVRKNTAIHTLITQRVGINES